MGSHAILDILLKDELHNGGFFGNTTQILDRQPVLVKAAKVDALISIRGRAAVVAAFFRKLFQVGTDANRSLFTFPGGLPEADIVGELVRAFSLKALRVLLVLYSRRTASYLGRYRCNM